MATQVHSAVKHLLKLHSQELIVEQPSTRAKLLKSGLLPTKDAEASQIQINATIAATGSAQGIADGGSLGEGGSMDPEVGYVNPKAVVDRLKIGRIAAKTAGSKKALVNYVKKQMEMCGKSLWKILNRMVYTGGSEGSPYSQVSIGAGSMEVTDYTAYQPGDVYEIRRAGVLVEEFRCKDVEVPVGTATSYTITFFAANAAQWETTDVIYKKGMYSNNMTCLNDITAAASLYSIAHTTADWRGNLKGSQGAIDATGAKDILTTTEQRAEEDVRALATCPLNHQRIYDSISDGIRFVSTGPMDQYGMTLQVAGVGVFKDVNCPLGDLYVLPDDNLYLAKWQDFEDEDGDPVSENTFTYDYQIAGLFNLVCHKRNSVGRITGIDS